MELENIVPLIIIAVAYLFKAFDSARKKDAKKGAPSPPRQRPPAPRPSATRQASQVPPAATPSLPQPAVNPSSAPEPPAAPRQSPRPGIPEGQWWEGSGTVPVNPERAAAEWRAQPRREARHSRKPVALVQLDEHVTEEEAVHEYADFDLQDAVIKSVILERREF